VVESGKIENFKESELEPMQTSSSPLFHVIRFGVFEVDLRSGELRKSGARIHMQEQPFQILVMLLERPAEVVTREELRTKLWPGDTFVDFEHGVNSAVARLREALGDSADSPRYVETLPRRGYRFIAAVEGAARTQVNAETAGANRTRRIGRESLPSAEAAVSQLAVSAEQRLGGSAPRLWVILACVVMGFLGVGSFFYLHSRHPLSETDSIVLADVVNSTADPVFDSTLRQALAIKLSESPFLNVVSEERMRDMLRFMARSPSERLTAVTAREVCQRLASKAMVRGQIAQLGDHYSILLEAVNCANGDSLARTEAEATNKGEVLRALDDAAANMRRRLGESLSSIKKYDVPIEQATTTSLEALKAFSLGDIERNRGAEPQSIPFFQHAIELDPNFAIAYAVLGQVYANVQESALSLEYTQKAFERRQRASEQEKFYITSHYYENVIRDVDKAIETYQLWQQTYSRDVVPRINLSELYEEVGEFDKALAEAQEAVRLDPGKVLGYSNLLLSYLYLNRLDEAKSTFDQALARGLDTEDLHIGRYDIAFLENDRPTMEQQLAWATDKPSQCMLLGLDALTAAFGGRRHTAEDLFREAVESAERYDRKELAAEVQAMAALTEAEFGYPDRARRLLTASLGLAKARNVQTLAILGLARAGDEGQAQTLAKQLSLRFAADTLLNKVWLPTIQAEVEISRGNANEAIRLLQPVIPYDVSKNEPMPFLFPAFVRGEAYLLARNGKAAEAEFQKILDHRSLVGSFPHGALAHLGLARARRLDGNLSGSRLAYQDFFAAWKEADSKIPVLQQAKAEYATLR
jgi:eukaryotic-like serine/threonine-protein kinase